jgi:hypothetical protein
VNEARRPASEPPVRHGPRHDDHGHVHDPFCGHPAVDHGDHVDFLHDGHQHHVADDQVHDVRGEQPGHVVHAGHMHVHGPSCGHRRVRHGDHDDFVHGLHRHARHEAHYDEH